MIWVRGKVWSCGDHPWPGHQSTRRERGFKRRVKRQLPSITGHYQTRGSPGTMGVLLRGNYTPASHQTQAHRDLMLTTQKSTDILPQSHHWTSTYIYIYRFPHQKITYRKLFCIPVLTMENIALNCIKFYDIWWTMNLPVTEKRERWATEDSERNVIKISQNLSPLLISVSSHHLCHSLPFISWFISCWNSRSRVSPVFMYHTM